MNCIVEYNLIDDPKLKTEILKMLSIRIQKLEKELEEI
jgi:hypothetical protein